MTYCPGSIGFQTSRLVTVLRIVFDTVVNTENIQIETIDKNIRRKPRVDTDYGSNWLTESTSE